MYDSSLCVCAWQFYASSPTDTSRTHCHETLKVVGLELVKCRALLAMQQQTGQENRVEEEEELGFILSWDQRIRHKQRKALEALQILDSTSMPEPAAGAGIWGWP